jgi:hypothetical protein
MNEFTKITKLRMPANGDFSWLNKNSKNYEFCQKVDITTNRMCQCVNCFKCIFDKSNEQYFKIWIEKYYMGGRK